MGKILISVFVLTLIFPKPVLATLGCEGPSIGGYGVMFGVLFFLISYLVWLVFSFMPGSKISATKMLVMAILFSFSTITVFSLLNLIGLKTGFELYEPIFYGVLVLILFGVNFFLAKKITGVVNKQLILIYVIMLFVLGIIWFGFANKLDILFTRIYWWIYAGGCRGMQGGT